VKTSNAQIGLDIDEADLHKVGFGAKAAPK